MWPASSDLKNDLEVTFEADKVVLPEGQDHVIGLLQTYGTCAK